MTANMYRVGDYVFFETSSTTPYQIRRIEELNKTPTGNVEAKVMCFYRRRDISSSLIQLADKHQNALDDDEDEESEDGDETKPPPSLKTDKEDLNPEQKHQLKHRELFLSRQVEVLPATHIRGKCSVTLLNETELLLSYLGREDSFFYSLVYDPQQKTLLADKGEIRVGSRYQAEVIPLLKPGETDGRNVEELEELVWTPEHPLSDKALDAFLLVSRSVGTFARALDCTSSVRQPSLHMSAAAASRDITLLTAFDLLHKYKYDLAEAMVALVPTGGPVLCRDEMEDWSASEANLFEEALDKYGKDFNDIRQDFLPWKSLKSIVEYYYMWKTTDRYVQQKRIKAAESESKLKQVYIPNYNKPNPAQLSVAQVQSAVRPCEGCSTMHSSVWFAWGPVHMSCRLCSNCWTYWKKYGGLKLPTRNAADVPSRPSPDSRQDRVSQMSATVAAQQRVHRCTIQGCNKEFRVKNHLARHLAQAHGLAMPMRPGSPRPVMKTRAAFCLITTPLTRVSRQLCGDILQIRRAGRRPFQMINIALIKQECQARLATNQEKIKKLCVPVRRSWERLVVKIGIDPNAPKIALLERMGPVKAPVNYAFPPRAPYNRTVPTEDPEPKDRPQLMKKRPLEPSTSGDQPAAKRPAVGVIRQAGQIRQQAAKPRGQVVNQMKNAKLSVIKTKRMSWVDAPDDVCFTATDNTRKLRKKLNSVQFRHLARSPWKLCTVVPTAVSGAAAAN